VPRLLNLRFRGRAASSIVRIETGGLDRLGTLVGRKLAPRRALLVTDARVGALYGTRVRRSLARAGIETEILRVPRGEAAKQPGQLARVWDACAGSGLGRGDAVVALGGGAVGDLAGFAAATWLRGVTWICVPTTVLAQVDSSVGGKTAVDLAAGKNLAGAFHQPALVLIDPATLATLPARERRAGLAEVVKTGMAVDVALFRWIEARLAALAAGEPSALTGAIERTVKAKARIVQHDEREAGPRTALNFGHTAGHAIEAALGYRRMRHGEAVAVGMRIAAALSVREAGLRDADRARLDAVLDALRLPGRMPPIPLAALEKAMRMDKKRGATGIRWVLTPRIGHASLPRLMTGRLVRSVLIEAGARRRAV
jgi:3-dehydroquinate synthase